jgi:hypothetical protein
MLKPLLVLLGLLVASTHAQPAQADEFLPPAEEETSIYVQTLYACDTLEAVKTWIVAYEDTKSFDGTAPSHCRLIVYTNVSEVVIKRLKEPFVSKSLWILAEAWIPAKPQVKYYTWFNTRMSESI